MKEWLEDLLSSIADFIISGITSFISDVIAPLLDTIYDYLVYIIEPAISGVISAIVNFINTYVIPAIDSLGQSLSSTISSLSNSIANSFNQLLSSVTDLSNALASGISSVINSISQGLSSLADSIANLGTTISSAIQGIVDVIVSTISNIADTIVNAISQGISSLADIISSTISGVLDALRNIADSIIGTITDIAKSLSQAISSIIDTISKAVSTISSALASMIDTIISTISNVTSMIVNAISQGISSLADIISSSVSVIFDAISNMAKSVVGVIQDIASSIANTISSVIDTISGAVKGIIDAISKVGASLSDLISNIVDGIASLGKSILDAISGAVESIADVISDIASSIASTLSDFASTISSVISQLFTNISDMVSGAIDTITNFIQTGFASVGDAINTLVSGFQSLVQSISEEFGKVGAVISEGFEGMGVAITGFINAILKFPEWFPKWFDENISKPLSNALGSLQESLSYGLEDANKELENLRKQLDELARDPYAIISASTEAVWSGLQKLGKVIVDSLSWLGNLVIDALKGLGALFQEGLKWLVDSFVGFGTTLMSGIADVLHQGLLGAGKGFVTIATNTIEGGMELASELGENIGKALSQMIKATVEPMGSVVGEAMEEKLNSLVERLSKGEQPAGEFLELMELQGGFLGSIVLAQALSHGYWAVFHGLGSVLERFNITLPIRIKVRGSGKASPLGVGAEAGAEGEGGVYTNLQFNLGLMLRALASEVREYGKTFGRGLTYGTAIWVSQPLMRLANSIFRNWLVVEMPTIPDLLEMIRRHMSHKEYEEVLESARSYLRLYGYRDSIIDWLTSEEEAIEVTDRFGNKRKVPVSLMYNLPSASDVATMMVRDIFPSIEEFQKLYSARGMHPDVGALYYFLRFRYPPPERLWDFTMRGISGLLWMTLPDAEKKEIEKTMKPLGAYMPISPVELNFKAEKLFSSLKTYMKWHDYFRGAWIKDFTSDNLIMTDILADIPSKIDQRWMLKWGLYQLLSVKQVTIKSPVSDFAEKVIENTPASKVTMDLTNFSRTLQATGIHPYWIPLTAVAESINALTDERTLLRTGFINLFKEGFWNTEALEKLLKGVIIASFKVAYFDIKDMKWKEGWINQPVMFLPAERKLLELRALMDRSLDILREIQRDITRGYVEWIIADYNEYKDKLTSVIDSINIFFTADYESITGAKLPDELKLKFVEEYYKPYVEALSIYKDIYTVRRIRYWTARWLGWVLYRVASGVVQPEDIKKLITYVKEYAKLTPKEAEYLTNIVEVISGIAIREYVPTPSMLVSFAEYITLPDQLIEAVFEARRIPEAWRKIWGQLIKVRPLADDIRGLLTTYRRALLYIEIPKEVDEAVKKYATLINFTDLEWDILNLRVQLEEMIRNSREYIPTMYSLATISEYVPEARLFFDEVAKARRIPKRWQQVWAKYVDLRPIYSDVKRMYSRIEDMYVRLMITEDDYKKALKELSKFGYTDKEIEFLFNTSNYEKQTYAWRELIGDVDRMTMLAEYSPKAREFALGTLEKMVDALPIDNQTKAVIKEMWKQFIRLKPVMDEVRRYVTELINDFVQGVITEADFVAELEALKEWGLDDYEIMFYKAIAGMKKARYLKRRGGS